MIRRILWLLLLACGWAQPLLAQPDPVEVGELLRRAAEQMRSTGRMEVAGQPLWSADTLPQLYEQRGFSLLWTAPANREAMLGEIAAMSGEGLEPADYHFDVLRRLQAERVQAAADARLAVASDLLFSDALIRLAAHLVHGKLDPVTLVPRWDVDGTLRGEPPATVLARIATGNALAIQLGELRPVQPLYGRLKSALARFRLAAEQGGWPEIGPGGVLQEGMEDPRVPLLRRRLAETGDFVGVVVDSPRFEPALAAALRSYQARRGLEPDGVFGPASRRALNVPAAALVDELRVNLERARWLLGDVRGRFLLLDPAGRRVVLMDNSEASVTLDAAFASGTRDIPPLRGELRYFVVNPDWILPPGLVRAQVAPLARRAPARLEASGLRILSRDGTPRAPASVNWDDPADVIVQQLPGPGSFLGAFRFPTGSGQGIFLHGAPAEPARGIAGSVRLEDPGALAAGLASPGAAWDAAAVSAALAAGGPQTFVLPRPVPVLYAPWTAWVDRDGGLHLRNGHEERDAAIAAGLARGAQRE
jgi:murein L,D-transpeptidase YcbB/YkuD